MTFTVNMTGCACRLIEMKYIFLGIIKLYRLTLSKILPPCCRFYPTCSEYGLTAIQRFGAVKGGYLTFWRIFRCNPFGNGGIDPVPKKFCFRPERFTVSRTETQIGKDCAERYRRQRSRKKSPYKRH